MLPIFWTGKLSPMMEFVVKFSNAIAWVTGNARDTAAMKQRTNMGYLSMTRQPSRNAPLVKEFHKHSLSIIQGEKGNRFATEAYS